ncbi:MAG TPA: tetratricopeptide repeat protein [Kofleriaceae bacterium]|nr:tetratricopeptide repeat protein [Kofleriaceae bacterium]
MGDLVFFSFGPRRGMRKGTSALEWYERGCALESSDADAAFRAYQRALAGRPDLADAHNNLGRLLHDRGDLVAAESCYRLALCLDNRVALYWFNLGVVLEDRGRAAEAIAAYEQALAIDALLADAHFNLARQIERAALSAGDEVLLRRAVRHLKQYRDLSRASG